MLRLPRLPCAVTLWLKFRGDFALVGTPCMLGSDVSRSWMRPKTRISLAKLDLPLAENVFVEARENAPGADPERRPLMRYIDREDLFAVIFSDMSLA